MPEIALYRVDGRNRVNLEGLSTPGVEYYTAVKGDDGAITLSPVTVVTTVVKRADTTADDTETPPTY